MKLLLELQGKSETDLQTMIVQMGSSLKKNSTIFLSADLGMGKTTFVAHFCAYFGINHTSSPTFSVHNRYQSASVTIDHFDLYRLEDEDAVMASGFYDLMSDYADYKIIEWPERLTESAKKSFARSYLVKIKKSAEGQSARDYSLFEI